MTFGRRHFLEKHMLSVHKMDMRSAFEQHAVIFLEGSNQVEPSALELQVDTIVDPVVPPPPPSTQTTTGAPVPCVPQDIQSPL
ncbi:hypothetical protein MRX96_028569 [Rhipicephalus microplus]